MDGRVRVRVEGNAASSEGAAARDRRVWDRVTGDTGVSEGAAAGDRGVWVPGHTASSEGAATRHGSVWVWAEGNPASSEDAAAGNRSVVWIFLTFLEKACAEDQRMPLRRKKGSAEAPTRFVAKGRIAARPPHCSLHTLPHQLRARKRPKHKRSNLDNHVHDKAEPLGPLPEAQGAQKERGRFAKSK
ncbi:hypothetical protein BDK51DRAFT_34084 [Blyttiomyces helicus]|uniref:Uncharacterized protein n=1 Tax=Blyttiomyces helicus TaxID=388810 RepID=A0A4P9WLT5_9FUNG|nr:hypothetical protein BDK51DRAFT_34084 [Blyttiomyces helicus]|eukprot:RKO94011.1 hypothetical protein BDK51DRAFT_34084 [Blyttiomyces helicus]